MNVTTICEFLSKLWSTLSSHYDPSSQLHEDVLQHCILNLVDQSTRKFLRLNDNMSLDNLAKQVDKLIDHIDRQATTFSLQSPSHHNSPPQHLINEMLEKRIIVLQQSLSHSPSSHNTTEHALNKETNAKPNFSKLNRSRNPKLSSSSNPNQACYYHQCFGARAFKCEGGSCPFSHNSPNTLAPRKLVSGLHLIGGQSSSQIQGPPLFFVSDSISGCKFLIGTGAIYSIYPSLLLPAPTPLLTTVGGGILHCSGIIKRDHDIGFSHLFHHEFSVADIDYGILGIDFLRKYHLTVDVSNNKLTASIDPERCKRDLVKEHDNLEVGFTLRSDKQTDNSLLKHYRNRFPEVFDTTLRSKTILHSVEATVEESHKKIVHSKARRIGPDKFIALKTDRSVIGSRHYRTKSFRI